MSAPETEASNAAQVEYWNATAGQTWARLQDQLDRQLQPLGARAMEALAPVATERLVDVGCGCGHTSLALAERVGPDGAVLGVDVSRPMLDVARRRAAAAGRLAVRFREADAQSDDLGQAAFDAVFSRFGVMFFSDPARAFRNLRASLRPAGRLAFVCWRAYAENLWMREPFDAASPHLPPVDGAATDPQAPGPFAFADPDRVRSLLSDAGFTAVSLTPFDAGIGGNDLDQTLELSLNVGPLAAALREAPERRAAVSDAVRRRLQTYQTPDGVLMPACVWIVTAHASG